MPFCIGPKCDPVLIGHYANPGGVPVIFCMAVIYFVLVLVMMLQPLIPSRFKRNLMVTKGVLCVIGAAASLWVSSVVEIFLLNANCRLCIASGFLVAFVFLAVLWLTLKGPSSGHRWITAIIVVAAIPAFLYLFPNGGFPRVSDLDVQLLRQHLIPTDAHSVVGTHAQMAVVEFGDLECEFCRQEQPIIEQILARDGDRIEFVFRNYPLTKIHPHAMIAAEATECAADQGQFWQAVREFYKHQNDLTIKGLDNYAGDLHLDLIRFDRCLSSGSSARRVQQDIEDGKALGVRGTPTFFIGSLRFSGTVSLNEFSALLESQLSGTRSHSYALSVTPIQIPSSNFACSDVQRTDTPSLFISTVDAVKYFDQPDRAVFVDVRPPEDFERGHIPQAINLPALEAPQKWNELPRNRTLVLYENLSSANNECAASQAVAKVLLTHGFPQHYLKIYREGIDGWKMDSLSVER